MRLTQAAEARASDGVPPGVISSLKRTFPLELTSTATKAARLSPKVSGTSKSLQLSSPLARSGPCASAPPKSELPLPVGVPKSCPPRFRIPPKPNVAARLAKKPSASVLAAKSGAVSWFADAPVLAAARRFVVVALSAAALVTAGAGRGFKTIAAGAVSNSTASSVTCVSALGARSSAGGALGNTAMTAPCSAAARTNESGRTESSLTRPSWPRLGSGKFQDAIAASLTSGGNLWENAPGGVRKRGRRNYRASRWLVENAVFRTHFALSGISSSLDCFLHISPMLLKFIKKPDQNISDWRQRR